MKKLSIYISLLLRHKPELLSLNIDKYGYVLISELVDKINANTNYTVDYETLVKMADESDKQRYKISEDGKYIKANQGHSINIEHDFKKVSNIGNLYHGTKKEYLHSIMKLGLLKGNRHHVHLSSDLNTAKIVANRRKGENVILEINASEMLKDGVEIFKSDNNVLLTDFVDSKYIKLYNE